MWTWDLKFDPLNQVFHKNRAQYIGIFVHTNYCNFARSKKYFIITRPSLLLRFIISEIHCSCNI